MVKLSEYKNEDAIELLADLIEPVSIVLADKEIVDAFRTRSKLSAIGICMKKYSKEMVDILAILERVPREEYECNLFTAPMKVLEILNDPLLQDFFTSQGLKMEEESSGSVMENTEDEEQ